MKVYVCEVFDHSTMKVLCRGIDLDECNGDAYNKCMKVMKDLPNAHRRYEAISGDVRCIPRYEFFCAEDSIDFQWRMNEEDYENFRKDTEPGEDMDYCGSLYFGKFSLEFMHITDNCRLYNLFCLDESGYDTLCDGTPYDDYPVGDDLPVPQRRTLCGFQRAVENEVYRMICKHPDMIVNATSATEPERWYPQIDGSHFYPEITRRA